VSATTAPRPDTVMGRALAARVLDLEALQDRTRLQPSDDLMDLMHSVPQPLPEHVRQAAKDALDRGETHYTTRPGVVELRRAIAEHATAAGFPAVVDRTVVTNGAAEALFIALQAALSPGARAAVVEPMAPHVIQMIRFVGAEVVPITPVADADFLVAPAAVAATQADVLVLASPSPVSGKALPPPALEAILGTALDRGMNVILDRSSAPCLFDPTLARIDDADLGARVITVGSFSSGYDLAGWRVGYFTAPTEQVAKLRGLKQAMSICTTAVSQYAALAALTGPDDWRAARRAEFAARLDAAVTVLREAGLPVIPPDAYPGLLVDTRRVDPDDAVVAERLRASGVVVDPCWRYGRSNAGFIRVDLGAERRDLVTGIGRIAQLGQGGRHG